MPWCEKGKHEAAMVSEVGFRGRPQEMWCCACWSADVHRRRAARKAELASMPRCEVPGCRRRANWQVGGRERLGMCGHHKGRAQRAAQGSAAGMGGLGLFMTPTYSRAELLRLAAPRGRA